MKTVLAATDFTPSSLNACLYAARLAEKCGCKLTVFNVYDIPVVHSNGGLYFISYENQKKVNEKKISGLIKKISAAFPKIQTELFLRTGALKIEMEDFISKHKVEAVVMGLVSKSKFEKIVIGSRSTDVAGRINAQVIIVPDKYKKHKIKKALLSVDNNEKLYHSSLAGVESFLEDAKMDLKVLHVRTEDELFKPRQDELRIGGKIRPVNTVKAKNIENGIMNFCKKSKADMIMILSKHHSVLYDLFAESHTKKIAFKSKVPVMAIHE